jgi:hypothetical protein
MTWTLNSPSQFRALPPPDLTSESWTNDYNEVKSLGGTTGSSRTPEQTDIGRFWADQPMLQWNRAWRGIALEQDLSLIDGSRFFAMLTTASSDALIACWDSKYFYNFWRPVTAIRAGSRDGNPGTMPDPNWIGLVVTPNHPEYPAAHGCFSGAATETLRFFFGTDEFDFTIDSNVPDLTDRVRYYDSFSQALQEVLDARVYGGMHYRNSSDKGAIIGKQVSHFATSHFFKSRTDAIVGVSREDVSLGDGANHMNNNPRVDVVIARPGDDLMGGDGMEERVYDELWRNFIGILFEYTPNHSQGEARSPSTNDDPTRALQAPVYMGSPDPDVDEMPYDDLSKSFFGAPFLEDKVDFLVKSPV